MATCCNPKGVTVIEVDGNGRILNTSSGYGQGWKLANPTFATSEGRANTQPCGSPEWLSEVVLAPDPDGLQSVIGQVTAGGKFQGDTTCGTSCTTCKGAVYRLPDASANAPQPVPADYKYYVMAQGTWIDQTTGKPLQKVPDDIGPNSRYLTSAFIISESPIDQIETLRDEWNTLRAQALMFFETLQLK
jgi:hypothetical protein